ncbi:type I restriction enzyme HsdR N-terminal domain-containing protein [Paenibacillus sp. S28]|uniref:type I restriction enzyme HsdR N-terminal domain-containing protein n=1 Tax=Paenibacillus sp. S28 TaxID=2767463 RepID=UPI00190BE8A4|nr:type I restriction enzyme HsdR N-terminal domain-containing protein [Paenibacillus sp. S28]MBJ9989427.1 type I restriction enzyme HsdR N-terminal domain-containing protein [Paenibacillus sp. S28]
MDKQELFNPLKDFNYNALEDSEFGEDSVREEIIFPIIKSLGYSSYGENKLIRSRNLVHPFVSIGSQQKKINIIPDYVMEIDGRPCWIMEAKGPKKNILDSKYLEQAYSYAMHSEIKAWYYALCNGKEFVLYHVSEYKPLLHFDIKQLPFYWEDLMRFLSPTQLLNNCNQFNPLNKDFGLHLKRLGFDTFNGLHFLEVPITFIAKLKDDLYTFATNIKEEDAYCVSFDFNHTVFLELKGKIPDEAYAKLAEPLTDSMINIRFPDMRYFVNVSCGLGENMEENNEEIFLPLVINKFL